MFLRADKLLHQQGHFESRKKAQVAIEKGLVCHLRNGQSQRVQKPAQEIDWQPGDAWEIALDREFAYVSRAGAKLKGALEEWCIEVSGLMALDIGLSTGGFTDCLLQEGVKGVLGVDVGREQLHIKLKDHPQLLSFDKINAKENLPGFVLDAAVAKWGKKPFDILVVDVSFISILQILKAQLVNLRDQGMAFLLVKPQFESSADQLNKKGVLPGQEGLRVLEKTVKTMESMGLQIVATQASHLRGEDGNQEYMVYAKKV